MDTITNFKSNSIQDFCSHMGEDSFPCVGAKSALARDQIVFCIADDIRTSESDIFIIQQLQGFAQNCTNESQYTSFIVIFEKTPLLDEITFEHQLWVRLQAIHDLDSQHYKWDQKIDSDPTSPHFSMSVGGKGFYVIGVHPGASRPARQFPKTALVFNLHSQFELLRENGSYDRIREAILARDVKLSGDVNPMLAEHGQSSEARQYSGRAVEDTWKCPFHAHAKETK